MAADRMTSCQPQKTKEARPSDSSLTWQVRWTTCRLVAKSAQPPFATLHPSPRFEEVVRASGGYGERVEDPEKFRPALERALKHVDNGTQALLNVVTQAGRH